MPSAELRSTELMLNGNSMFPAVKNMDVLEIEYFDQPKVVQEFTEGELLLIRPESEWIVHRVVNSNGQLRTKGDWSLHMDPVGSVWGKVVSVNGKKSHFLFSPKVSQFSKKINAQNKRMVRRFNRAQLYIYITVRKFFSK